MFNKNMYNKGINLVTSSYILVVLLFFTILTISKIIFPKQNYFEADHVLIAVISSVISYIFIFYIKKIERKILEKEKELILTQNKYTTIFNTTPSPIFILETENFKILDVNKSAIDKYGYSKEEFEILNFTQLFEKCEVADLKLMLEDENLRLNTYIHQKKDGTTFPVELYSYFSFIDDVKNCVVIVNDITERWLTEKAFRESEIRYKALFESANDGIFVMDEEKFLECNKKALELFGCKSEDILGQPPYKFSPIWQPDGVDSQQKARKYIGLALSGTPQFFQWRHIRLDGTPFDAEVTLSAININGKKFLMAIVRDITQRKQAEVEIHDTLTRLRMLNDQLPALIWTTNRSLIFTSSSGSGFKNLNLDHSQLIGNSIAYFFETDDLEYPPIQNHILALKGKSQSFEFVKGGRIYRASVEPLKNIQNEIEGVICVAQDITEERHALEELRKKEELYKLLVENATDGIYLIHNRKFVFVNPKFLEITGYSIEEISSENFNFMDIISPEYHELIRKREEARKKGDNIPSRYEFDIVDKSGKIKTVEVNTVPIKIFEDGFQVLGIIRDVSDRKEIEKQQEKLQLQLEIFFRTSLDGCFFMLMPEGMEFYWNDAVDKEEIIDIVLKNQVITMVNNALLEQYGAKDESELLGKTTIDFYDHDIQSARKDLKDMLDKGSLRILRKGRTLKGEELWIDGQYVVMYDSLGRVFGYFGIQKDVTKVLREQEEKNSLEKMLMQAQKLEALGTLSGGIAHDINNILGIILGAVELAKKKNEKEEINNYLNMISGSAERGISVVKQLLFFSRVRDAKFNILSIIKLIDVVKNILLSTFPKNISVIVEIDTTNDYLLNGDEGLLQQALINLAINSRDAMPNGGTLKFLVRKSSTNEIKKITYKVPEAQYVAISVIDSGIGMDEETMAHIFEPFFTKKELGKGTGLGLSIVYRIISQHNGFIDVQSKLGEGTKITLYIPLIDKDKLIRKHEIQANKKHFGKNILLIDDEQMLRELLTEMFTEAGYKLLTAKDGLEGVEIYERYKDQIDLVISDIGMPRMGGEEAFKKLKEINPDVKLVFISGFLEIEKKQELEKSGVKAIIHKPFQGHDILNIVRKILDES